MQVKIKKIEVVIYLIFAIIISGCSSNNEKTINGDSFMGQEMDNCASNYNCFEYETKEKIGILNRKSYLLNEESAIFLDREDDDNKNCEKQCYMVNYKTGEQMDLNLGIQKGESGFIKNIYFNKSEKNYLAVDGSGKQILMLDSEWNEQKRLDIEFLSDNENIEIIGCDTQYIYVSGATKLDEYQNKFFFYVLDYEGNVIYKEEDGRYLCLPNECKGCKFINGEDDILFTFEKDRGMVELTGYEVFWDDNFYPICYGDAKYDIYGVYKADGKNYLIGLTDSSFEKIINFSEYKEIVDLFDNTEQSFDSMIINTNGEYTICLLDELTYEITAITMKSSESKHVCDVVEKTKITICLDADSWQMDYIVSAFNSESEKYKVECKTYDELSEDNKEQKLYMDILKSSDIDGVISTKRDDALMSSGALLDLNEYFEYSENVKKEDLIDCVINSVTNKDGKIYYIYPYFDMVAYEAKGNNNISDYCSYGEWVESGKAIALKSYSPTQAICTLVRYSGDTLFNEKEKTIDVEKLKNLIEMVKRQSDKGLLVEDMNVSDSDLFNNDYIIFDYSELIMEYGTIINRIAMLDDELNMSVMATNCPVIRPESTNIAITTTSKNKEGMYEFLDFIFNDFNYNKYFCDMPMHNDFPVLKTAYDDIANHISQRGEYYDRFGRLRCFDGIDTGSGYTYDFDKEKTINRFNELVNSAIYIEPVNESIEDVISVETAPYFEGKQTIDETMSNIEKKVNDILRDIDY